VSPARADAIARRVLLFAVTLVVVVVATALTAGGAPPIRALPLDYGTEIPATTTTRTTTETTP
jgi:hypothetical protein